MPTSPKVTEEQRKLVRAFICAQRRVRRLDRDSEQTLPMAEFHTLMALEQSDSLTPGDIADLLNINLSKTTRVIQRLEAEKLVKVSPLEHDARHKEIVLTNKGAQLLQECDSIVDKRTSAWFNRLSSAHQKVLKDFLAALADALHAPEEKRLRDEVEIRVYQRRIARAGGLIGGPVLSGGLNLVEYQILNFLIEQPEVTMEKLFELPFDRAQISRTSDLLQRLGFLKKSRDPADSRRIRARLTEKGEREFLKAEEKAAQIIADATGQLAARKFNLLLTTLQHIAR